MKKVLQTKESEMVIYTGSKGNVSLRAQVDKETMWATQAEIAKLFDVDRSVVTKHLKNIFSTGELVENSNVQKMHIAISDKPVSIYNLDVILSVGYRVNSKKATQFRIWATETLREYLLHGYALNRQVLLTSKFNTLKELEKTVDLISSVALRKKLEQDEMSALLSVIKDYTHSFTLLREYDSGDVLLNNQSQKPKDFSYENIVGKIQTLKNDLLKRGETTEIFAQERDGSFKGIIGNIHQSFGGQNLYKSIEERSAHLLYFVIKDHPFVDGNKRTGAFLFVHYLDMNKKLYRKNGEKIISDNTLTALALLVAESDPKEKEQMIALITQLIK